jgi:hypothetical protein
MINLAPGRHIAIVRFVSGSSSSLFAATGPALLSRTWNQSHWWAE